MPHDNGWTEQKEYRKGRSTTSERKQIKRGTRRVFLPFIRRTVPVRDQTRENKCAVGGRLGRFVWLFAFAVLGMCARKCVRVCVRVPRKVTHNVGDERRPRRSPSSFLVFRASAPSSPILLLRCVRVSPRVARPSKRDAPSALVKITHLTPPPPYPNLYSALRS